MPFSQVLYLKFTEVNSEFWLILKIFPEPASQVWSTGKKVSQKQIDFQHKKYYKEFHFSCVWPR